MKIGRQRGRLSRADVTSLIDGDARTFDLGQIGNRRSFNPLGGPALSPVATH